METDTKPVLPLDSRHAEDVARLHQKYLQTQFKHYPGMKLLSFYYSTLTAQMGGCGYVIANDNAVLGYICAIWDGGAVRRLTFKKHAPMLLFWAIIQVIVSPSLLLRLWDRVWHRSGNRTVEEKAVYEIRPIVVDKAAQGSGVAGQLIKTIMDDARRRGFSEVCLYTEIDNVRARKFYEKMGFNLNAQPERQHEGYVFYTIAV